MVTMQLVFFMLVGTHASSLFSKGDEESTSEPACSQSTKCTQSQASQYTATVWKGNSLLQVRSNAGRAVVWDEDDEDQHEHNKVPVSSAGPKATKVDSTNANTFVTKDKAEPPLNRPTIRDDLQAALQSSEDLVDLARATKTELARLDPISMLSPKYDIDNDPAKPLQDSTEEQVAAARAFNQRPAETLWSSPY